MCERFPSKNAICFPALVLCPAPYVSILIWKVGGRLGASGKLRWRQGRRMGQWAALSPCVFWVLFVSDQHLWQFWIEMLHNATIFVFLDLLSCRLGPRFPTGTEQLGWQERNYDSQCLFWLLRRTSGKTLFQKYLKPPAPVCKVGLLVAALQD